MTATTTLKLPEKLKTRIARLARETGRSAHSLMVEALEREVAREERMREFVREALASDAAVEEGAAVYRAEDVHPWLGRLARHPPAARRRRGRRTPANPSADRPKRRRRSARAGDFLRQDRLHRAVSLPARAGSDSHPGHTTPARAGLSSLTARGRETGVKKKGSGVFTKKSPPTPFRILLSDPAAKPLIDPRLEGADYAPPANVKFYAIEDLGEAGGLYERIWTELNGCNRR